MVYQTQKHTITQVNYTSNALLKQSRSLMDTMIHEI